MYSEDILYVIRQTLKEVEWRFEGIYQPNNEEERKKLIEEIFKKIPLTSAENSV